jgi:adenylate cyclase
MRSVKLKLTALVLGSMVPAFAGAVFSGLESRKDLLAQVGEVIDGANDRFERILDDTLKGRQAPLVMAGENAHLAEMLARGDRAGVREYLEPLKKAYRRRVVLLSDAKGHVLASGNPEDGPISLAADGSQAFEDLLAGQPLEGLVPITTNTGAGHALVSAMPIRDDRGAQVGALAVFSPVTDGYISYLGRRVDADLALTVNGEHVAAATDHAAPELRSQSDAVTFRERTGRLWAVKSFKPQALQRPGLVAELTAAHDVTELRDESRAALWKQLGILAGLTIVVLGIALGFARRLARGVKGISDAAGRVKAGDYVAAPVLSTGDELESLALHFNEMVQGLKERDRLKETFGRYLTRQVAEHLMSADQQLGGKLIPATVLFSDIRSFTAISERMEPRALLDFLNEYFSGMVESVMHHHGVVDKFIGDAIMAVFGAPVPDPKDPLRAVCAALEMRGRLQGINEEFLARGLPEIRAGIGLHSGQVVAGNMGHSQRMEYTVIGDAVNLASRLEGMTKELACDIVLSEDLYRQVQDEVNAEPLHEIKVKGRDQPVMVYRLIDLKDGALGA